MRTPDEQLHYVGNIVEKNTLATVEAVEGTMKWFADNPASEHLNTGMDGLMVLARALAGLRLSAEHLQAYYNDMVEGAPPPLRGLVDKIFNEATATAEKMANEEVGQ